MKFKLTILFLFLAGPISAFAVNNYYVSPTGSGTACTIGSPCATINQALTTATVGSGATVSFGSPVWLTLTGCGAAIHVLSGTYNAEVDDVKSGSSGAQICVVSETQYGAKITNNNFQILQNFEIFAGFDDTNPKTSCTTLNCGGGYAINLRGSNDQILYNYLHDFSVNGCGQFGVITPGGSNNTMIGNIIRHAGSYTVADPNNNHCVTLHGIYRLRSVRDHNH